MKPHEAIKKGSNKAHAFMRIKQNKDSQKIKREIQKPLVNDTTKKPLIIFLQTMKKQLQFIETKLPIILGITVVVMLVAMAVYGSGNQKIEVKPQSKERIEQEIIELDKQIRKNIKKDLNLLKAKTFDLKAICIKEDKELPECVKNTTQLEKIGQNIKLLDEILEETEKKK